MAQEWAQQCIFDHGQPDRDPMPHATIGQNLYVKTSTTVVFAPLGKVLSQQFAKNSMSFHTTSLQIGMTRRNQWTNGLQKLNIILIPLGNAQMSVGITPRYDIF